MDNLGNVSDVETYQDSQDIENYFKFCRLCAIIPEPSQPPTVDVFGTEGMELNLLDKIELHLDIKITEEDGLPHGICSRCIRKLNVTHILLLKSVAALDVLTAIKEKREKKLKMTQQIKLEPAPIPNEVINCQLINIKTEGADNMDCDIMDMNNVPSPVFEEEVEYNEILYEPAPKLEPEMEVTPFEDYATLIPLCKGSQLAFAFLEIDEYSMYPRINVVVVNVPEMVQNFELSSTLKRITDNVKRRSKMILEYKKEDPTLKIDPEEIFGARFQCLTCNCSFYVKEEMVFHFESLHPTQINSCGECGESVCGPEDVFAKHVQGHSANESDDLELLLSLTTTTHESEMSEPEYILIHLGEIHERLKKNLSSEKTLKKLTKHSGIKSDMQNKLVTAVQNFIDKYTPPEIRIQCTECVKFFGPNSINIHKLKVHHPDKSQCPHCEVMVKEHEILIHVERRHSGGKTLVCKICDKAFAETGIEQPHMQKELSCNFKCSQCGRIFPEQELLDKHIKMSHDAENQKLKCPIVGCNFHHKNKETIELHFNTKHTEEDKNTYLCAHCGMSERSKALLKLHINRKHVPKPVKPVETYVCDKCGKMFHDKYKYNTHVRHICQRPKIPCDICGKEYPKHIMTDHKKIHDESSKKYQCRYCGSLFRFSNKCKEHERRHEGYVLNCQICTPKQYFRTLRAANEHRAKHERGEEIVLRINEPVQCQLCYITLKSRRNLKYHMKVHEVKGSNEPVKKGGAFQKALKFACYVCFVRYSNQEQYDHHLQAYHPEGVPEPDFKKYLANCFKFQCMYCPKQFKKSDIFRDHEASHRGEKNHSCPHCAQTFYYVGEKTEHAAKCEYNMNRRPEPIVKVVRTSTRVRKPSRKKIQDPNPIRKPR